MSSPVRICEKCGKSIPADAEFCPHCGARKETPRRSVLERIVDSFFTVLVVLVALLFGLAGACFLLLGLSGVGGSAPNPNAILLGLLALAVGIGLLMVAFFLIRRAAQKSGR